MSSNDRNPHYPHWIWLILGPFLVSFATTIVGLLVWSYQTSVDSASKRTQARIDILTRVTESAMRAGYLYGFRIRATYGQLALFHSETGLMGPALYLDPRVPDYLIKWGKNHELEFQKSLEYDENSHKLNSDLILVQVLFGDVGRDQTDSICALLNDSLWMDGLFSDMASSGALALSDSASMTAILRNTQSFKEKFPKILTTLWQNIDD